MVELQQQFYSGQHYGRDRCEAGAFPRHRHAFGYVCLVLSGRFTEAGDLGRFRLHAGHAVVHQPFEAHLDIFGRAPADVLNLPLVDGLPEEGVIGIDDADAIARLAETDPLRAASAIAACYRPVEGMADWPDLLARDLARRQDLCLREWAARHRLAPETLSRGFARAYGTTPARFRSEMRARRACRTLPHSPSRLADVAHDLGFADQSHMTRAVTTMIGKPPRAMQRQLRSRPG